MTVFCVRDENWNVTALCLPVLFLILLVCYGAGSLVGLVELPLWKKRHHQGISPAIAQVRGQLREGD